MEKTARRKTCIFCGERNVTKEHIFGKQWQKNLPNIGVQDKLNRSEITGRDEQGKYITKTGNFRSRDHPINMTHKCVCQSCNNGWMSRIDEAAIPALAALLGTSGGELDVEEQKSIAEYAYLKSFIIQANSFDQIPIPARQGFSVSTGAFLSAEAYIARQREEFFESRSAANDLQIYIGKAALQVGVALEDVVPLATWNYFPLGVTRGRLLFVCMIWISQIQIALTNFPRVQLAFDSFEASSHVGKLLQGRPFQFDDLTEFPVQSFEEIGASQVELFRAECRVKIPTRRNFI